MLLCHARSALEPSTSSHGLTTWQQSRIVRLHGVLTQKSDLAVVLRRILNRQRKSLKRTPAPRTQTHARANACTHRCMHTSKKECQSATTKHCAVFAFVFVTFATNWQNHRPNSCSCTKRPVSPSTPNFDDFGYLSAIFLIHSQRMSGTFDLI
jgi:hypothetical protein